MAASVRRSVVAVLSRGGAGSGTAWGDGTLVVTNHHVAPNDSVRVIDHTGAAQSGEVIAREPESDLAIIRVERPLEPARAGDATLLRPGQRVFAVGNPLGLQGAVTAGVVLARPAKDEMVRADILLQPGNSGGPLVTAGGAVIGINSMVIGGLGLAVPVSLAERQAAEAGTPVGVIGFSGQFVEGESPETAGLLLTEIAAGSAAEAAGLIPGDLVLEIDGVPVASGRPRVRAGTSARVRLVRAAQSVEVDVVPRALN